MFVNFFGSAFSNLKYNRYVPESLYFNLRDWKSSSVPLSLYKSLMLCNPHSCHLRNLRYLLPTSVRINHPGRKCISAISAPGRKCISAVLPAQETGTHCTDCTHSLVRWMKLSLVLGFSLTYEPDIFHSFIDNPNRHESFSFLNNN